MATLQLVDRLFAASPSVRYVAVYRNGSLEVRQRPDLSAASAADGHVSVALEPSPEPWKLVPNCDG